MLTYITRRVLYSIPVILIASFILFFAVRQTFDPCARARASKDKSAVERCREQYDLNDPVFVQYGSWLGDAVQGDLGESERTNDSVKTMVQSALWYTRPADLLGDPGLGDLVDPARRVLGREAVLGRRLRVHRAVVPGARAPAVRVRVPRDPGLRGRADGVVQPDGTALLLRRAPRRRRQGLQRRLREASGAAGDDADRPDHRRVEPVPTRRDARRDGCGLRAHRAGEGRAAPEGRHASTHCATR